MKNICLLLLLFVSLLTESCYRYYHLPTGSNMPLFKEKGEAKILVAVGSYDIVFPRNLGVEIQGAYAVTDKTALGVSFFNSGSRVANDSERNTSYELMYGAFHTLSSGDDFAGIFEIYGGFANGFSRHNFSDGDYARANYFKPFIQPNIGFRKKSFEVALGLRLGRLNYYNFQSDFSSGNNDFNELEFGRLTSKNPFLMVEPAISFRGGGERFKVCWQFTRAFANNLNGDNSNGNAPFAPYSISLGFSLNAGILPNLQKVEK